MPYAMSATFETQPVVSATTDWFVIDGGAGKGADIGAGDGICECGWSVDEARRFAVGAVYDDTAVVSGAMVCSTDWLVEVGVADADADLLGRKSFLRGFFIVDVYSTQPRA
jgi:Ca2+-binding RTX toxin-like protein